MAEVSYLASKAHARVTKNVFDTNTQDGVFFTTLTIISYSPSFMFEIQCFTSISSNRICARSRCLSWHVLFSLCHMVSIYDVNAVKN